MEEYFCSLCGVSLKEMEVVWGDDGKEYCFDCYFEKKAMEDYEE